MSTTIDPAAIVRRICPGAHLLEVAPLQGGVSAESYLLCCACGEGAAERLVVRRHRALAGKAGTPAERAWREFGVLNSLHAQGLEVPRPRCFCEPDILVVDFIDGKAELPPSPGDELARVLADIHRQSAAELPPLPSFTDPVPDLQRWLPRLASARQAQQYRGANAGELRLVHGDFWPGNLLWRGAAVVAVLDWEDALLGDPLIDLACMRSELFRLAGMAAVEAFTAAYGRRLPIDAARLAWWDLYMATAPLVYMHTWGLAEAELRHRRDASTAWQQRARLALGLTG